MFICSFVYAQQSSIEQVLPVKLYGQHLIVVQGSIGSLGKRNFVIDTGAYPSIIDRGVARKMKLSGHAEEVDAVNQTVLRMAVLVPSFDVGPIHAGNVRALVDDLSHLSERTGVRIDGLLGLDVLRRSSFRIDYVAKKISFGKLETLSSSTPFEIVEGMICLALRREGQSIRLLVDTGAEKTLLLGPHIIDLLPHSHQPQEFRNLAGHFKLRQVRLENLRLGDTDLTSQPIFVSDATDLPPYQFDGFLSTSQFRQIAFDFERQEFSWITRENRMEGVSVALSRPAAPESGREIAATWIATPAAIPDRDVPGLSCGRR